MKKIITFLAIVLTMNVFAQYTKLFDFANTTSGQRPNGDLMQASDGMLYGMTRYGGASGVGVLFQYNPATSTYTNKVNFNAAIGGIPQGSLMQANDGMLYGMNYGGGANSAGVLFQYNTATSTYTQKFDFDSTNGSNPWGSLMQANDGMLYGMTSHGGANNMGVLFQYNPTTNTLTKKLDFSDTTSGGYPNGSLMQASDGMLYGMTQNGGANYSGVLFQYNPATSTYTKKLDFNTAASGQYPYGSLMQASDGMLYGMTEQGTVGGGFQYNPATNTFTNKFSFAGTTINGQFPDGSLMQANDGMLYGMTSFGGAHGDGVLFKYGGAIGIKQFANSNEVSIYPNPTCDQFFIETNISDKLTVDLFDVNGRHVFSKSVNDKSIINVTSLNEGIYTLTIKSADRVINKKLVILR